MIKNSLRQIYFKSLVLNKYIRSPEKYQVEDHDFGGSIIANYNYYNKLQKNEADMLIGFLRYGKRILNDGKKSISIIEADFESLPKSEKLHWSANLIKEPKFRKNDKSYRKNLREHIGAEFIKHSNPIEKIIGDVKNINNVCAEKFFQNEANPYLNLAIDSEEDYRNAHKELYKIIGPDSLNKKLIMEILKDKLNVSTEDMLNSDKTEKGSWTLFKLLLQRLKIDFEPFSECHESRKRDAHLINRAIFKKDDFNKRFNKNCIGIWIGLKKLKEFLEK